jgi:diketogulonate reductase-like aldo/keto reductase
LLSDPIIAAIAAAHGRTTAQVILRWHHQRGCVPIPRSSNARRQLGRV